MPLQEPLPSNIHHMVEDEYAGKLSDISSTLDNIETAVSYLISVGSQPDALLQHFMNDVLRINRKLLRRGKVNSNFAYLKVVCYVYCQLFAN